MSRAAAFFDLDRTLLKGASGPLLTEALVRGGVVPDRHVPGQGMLYQLYELAGESAVTMGMARQAARLFAGRDPEAVRQAADRAADDLVDRVLPYVVPLLDEHRDAGRPVVLATTTPHDLVAALADDLGFDDVVATRYAEDGGGVYTGRLEGEFVWARGKLNAVRRWAG